MIAQRGERPPPMLAITGDTGSGKTAIQHLAGGMLGAEARDVALGEAKDTARAIGLALEEGSGLLFIDEVGRTANVYSRLEPILKLNTTIRFDAKFQNERTLRVCAPLSLLGSTLPPAILKSPEMSRRVVGYRLVGKHDWEQWGDLRHLRRQERFRPMLDAITVSLWELLFEEGRNVNWRKLCFDRFDAVSLEELDLDDSGAKGA